MNCSSSCNRYMTECWGTFLLVLIGCGSALFTGDKIGILGVGLAFGLILIALAYSVGPVSGCHLNPAVTLCLAISGKIEKCHVPGYIVSQLVGAVLAGATLYWIASGKADFSLANGFACNGFAEHSPSGYSMIACLGTEAILTAVLLYVVLATTRPYFPVGFGGLAAGGTLAALILVAGPITNASFNFARTLGTAVIHGGWALSQLWVFLVAHLIGVVLAVVAAKLTLPEELKS